MPFDIGDWLSRPEPGKPEPCGLFDKAKDVPVPLRKREVSATVYTNGFFADNKEVLSYVADVDCSAVFRFPLPPRSAVYRFHATIGDREVTTQVKPRAQAREEYKLAVQQGHNAVHMAQHEAGAALFEVSVGNLSAGVAVEVRFAYLRLLECFGGTLEWSHVATWVPSYVGSAGDRATGLEKVAAAEPTFSHTVTYTLSYNITVLADEGAVRSIESPASITVTRPLSVEAAPTTLATDSPRLERWHVCVSGGVSDPSRDLTLAIELDPAASRRTSLRVQRTPAAGAGTPSGGSSSGGGGAGGAGGPRTIALATFVPPLLPPPPPSSTQPSPETGQQPPKSAVLAKEIWFVVDCSGSMCGAPIKQAQEAALFFVRDLPPNSGVRFNVTCFGSNFKSLYDSCRAYDSDSEATAVSWIQQHVQADMGGTEILGTLQHIYQSPIAPGYRREIIFLTDGGISGYEEERVYELITPQPTTTATTASLTHVLSLGIGHGVHRGLLDEMGRRSNGLAAYVLDEENISAKTSFLKRAATSEGAVMRPKLVARGALVRLAPHVLPQRLFPGEPLHVLVEVLNNEPDATLELTAEYDNSDETVAAGPPPQLQLSLPLGAVLTSGGGGGEVEEGEALGVLHAMAYIGSLMTGTSPLHMAADGSLLPTAPSQDVVRDTIVRLAVDAGLVTPYTSAVGVSLRRDPAGGGGSSGGGRRRWWWWFPCAAAAVVEVPLQFPAGRALWAQQTQVQQWLPSAAVACASMPRSKGITKSARPRDLILRSVPPAAVGRYHLPEAEAEAEAVGAASPMFAAAAAAVAPPPFTYTLGSSTETAAQNVCVPPPAQCQRLDGSELVTYLNLHRTTEGYWRASVDLAAVLGLPYDVLLTATAASAAVAASAVLAARPDGLSDDGWATVVALACLRRRAAGQSAVWSDMAAKAVGWLEGRWPAGVKSVGGTVLVVARTLE